MTHSTSEGSSGSVPLAAAPYVNERAAPVNLAALTPGTWARVLGYQTNTDEMAHYAARLSRLGLIRGTEFQVVRAAPLGDPVEIRFRGFLLCLRPTEASCLQLTLLSPPQRPTS